MKKNLEHLRKIKRLVYENLVLLNLHSWNANLCLVFTLNMLSDIWIIEIRVYSSNAHVDIVLILNKEVCQTFVYKLTFYISPQKLWERDKVKEKIENMAFT